MTEAAYLCELTKPKPTPASPASLAAIPNPGTPLRRMLFIGDCMWEPDQLFPEIRKFCELDVLDLSANLKGTADGSESVVHSIENHAASADPDLIFFYLRPALLSEAAFSAIRKKWSCPLVGMNLDDRVEFFPYGILKSQNDNYAQWIRSFDLNLTSSLTAMDWYRERGVEVRHFPQGFRPDPRFANPPDGADFEYPFSFVGSWKPERGDLLDGLEAHGLRPALFGKGWKDSQWIDDPAKVFRSSQINLGIGYALASAKIANAKGRDIECPAVGSCYLTTYHWELAEMFEIGKEVICYRNLEELVELVTYFSKRPEACLKIAKAAHRRAHLEHTWENRLRGLFQGLGFQITG